MSCDIDGCVSGRDPPPSFASPLSSPSGRIPPPSFASPASSATFATCVKSITSNALVAFWGIFSSSFTSILSNPDLNGEDVCLII